MTIFLRGGADSLHVFVPYGDPLYYDFRKSLALHANVPTNAKSRGGEKGVLPIGKSDYWGINRHMKDLLPMMEAGTLVPILNVGSPDPTRSHFSAQDYMERASFGANAVTTGWLNRYLEATKKPFDPPLRGLSARTLVPRALRGNYPVLAGDNHTEKLDLFEDLYSSKNLVGMDARSGAGEQKGMSLDEAKPNIEKRSMTSDMTRDVISASGANAVERIKALEKVERVPNNARYPGGELGEQLRVIARVIKADVGLEVAQADYGGWDHHSGQGANNGKMSQMLGHLTDCIAAFTKDLGPRMDRTMLLVMTEFGRTVHENGSDGTDHGRASFHARSGQHAQGRADVWHMERAERPGQRAVPAGAHRFPHRLRRVDQQDVQGRPAQGQDLSGIQSDAEHAAGFHEAGGINLGLVFCSLPESSSGLPASNRDGWFSPVLAPLLRHRLLSFALALGGTGQIVATMLHAPTMTCPVMQLFRVPCPGCGASRACVDLLHGHWWQMGRMHALRRPLCWRSSCSGLQR